MTAGPTFDTMGDFWRMVWEQEVGVVIMITGLIERGVVSPLHQSTLVHSNHCFPSMHAFIVLHPHTSPTTHTSHTHHTHTEQVCPVLARSEGGKPGKKHTHISKEIEMY